MKKGTDKEIEISYIRENSPLGTAGFVYLLKKYKYEDFFIEKSGDYNACTEYYGNHTLPEFTQNKEFELEIDIYPKIPLTIITPSIRPENLPKILKSMNFDYVTKWVIVYDMEDNAIEKQFEEHPNVDEYFYKGQMPSNSQRNFGVQLVQDGYVYFLDDDNLMHSDFWDFYKTITVKNKILVNIGPNKVWPETVKNLKTSFLNKE